MEEEIIKEHEKAKELIEDTLSEDNRSRNDDLWLMLKVWKKQGINVYVEFTDLPKMFRPETITRMRRVIQNTEGRFLPTDIDVLIKRKVKEQIIKDYFASGHQDDIVQKWQEKRYGVK